MRVSSVGTASWEAARLDWRVVKIEEDCCCWVWVWWVDFVVEVGRVSVAVAVVGALLAVRWGFSLGGKGDLCVEPGA